MLRARVGSWISGLVISFPACGWVLKGMTAGAHETNDAGGKGRECAGSGSGLGVDVQCGLTLMRGPVRIPDRDSTASAYVRWDTVNIRKCRRIRKGRQWIAGFIALAQNG